MADAITRIEVSVDTLTSAVNALIANQTAITAQLRAAAASVPDADTTIQLNALADKLDTDTSAEVQARSESEAADRQLRVAELQLTRDIAVMKQAQSQNESVQQINAELAQATMADRTRKEIEAANIAVEQSNPQHHGVAGVAPQPAVKD